MVVGELKYVYCEACSIYQLLQSPPFLVHMHIIHPSLLLAPPIPLIDILGCCIKTIETCLGDEPSPVLLDLYKKRAKLVEGNEKIGCISKVCI